MSGARGHSSTTSALIFLQRGGAGGYTKNINPEQRWLEGCAQAGCPGCSPCPNRRANKWLSWGMEEVESIFLSSFVSVFVLFFLLSRWEGFVWQNTKESMGRKGG